MRTRTQFMLIGLIALAAIAVLTGCRGATYTQRGRYHGAPDGYGYYPSGGSHEHMDYNDDSDYVWRRYYDRDLNYDWHRDWEYDRDPPGRRRYYLPDEEARDYQDREGKLERAEDAADMTPGPDGAVNPQPDMETEAEIDTQ